MPEVGGEVASPKKNNWKQNGDKEKTKRGRRQAKYQEVCREWATGGGYQEKKGRGHTKGRPTSENEEGQGLEEACGELVSRGNATSKTRKKHTKKSRGNDVNAQVKRDKKTNKEFQNTLGGGPAGQVGKPKKPEGRQNR